MHVTRMLRASLVLVAGTIAAGGCEPGTGEPQGALEATSQAVTTTHWVPWPVPVCARSISHAGPITWAIECSTGPDGRILQWEGSGWEVMPGLGKKIVLSSGRATPWKIDSAGGVWKWNGSAWKPKFSCAVDVAVGDEDDAWIVECGTGAIRRWNGMAWQLYPGLARAISANIGSTSGNGAWVVGTDQAIYQFDGSGWAPRGGLANWRSIISTAFAEDVRTYPANYSASVVGTDGRIYRWGANGWELVMGPPSSLPIIALGGEGIAVDSSGAVFAAVQ